MAVGTSPAGPVTVIEVEAPQQLVPVVPEVKPPQPRLRPHQSQVLEREESVRPDVGPELLPVESRTRAEPVLVDPFPFPPWSAHPSRAADGRDLDPDVTKGGPTTRSGRVSDPCLTRFPRSAPVTTVDHQLHLYPDFHGDA